MNKQKQIEAMARVDGDLRNDELGIKTEDAREAMRRGYVIRATTQLELHDCDYMHDHNAVQRVIDGLTPDELHEYHCILEGTYWLLKPEWFHLMTCEQKVEAILKAKGLWEEEA